MVGDDRFKTDDPENVSEEIVGSIGLSFTEFNTTHVITSADSRSSVRATDVLVSVWKRGRSFHLMPELSGSDDPKKRYCKVFGTRHCDCQKLPDAPNFYTCIPGRYCGNFF